MTDVLSLLRALNRPRLLVSAARFGLKDYRRETFLKRLLKIPGLPGHTEITLKLLEIEAELDETRQNGAANYDAFRHIEVLVALMAECRLLTAQKFRVLTEN